MAVDEFYIDNLVDECIDNLASDSINSGAESLIELAHIWAKSGLGMRAFLNMRQFIINEASDRTDVLFISEKLKLAERKLRDERTGTKIIVTVH